MRLTWREAMTEALYGDDGFFRTHHPADQFRTSAHAGTLLAEAVLELLGQVDHALGRPERLDLVDIGAGGGELLTTLLGLAPADLRPRLRPIAVELAPRPSGRTDDIVWRTEPPEHISGLVIATEWLDNVPLDLAELTADGWRYVLLDDSPGARVVDADLAWLERWWADGPRAEIGITRDTAWADAVAHIDAGLALAIDYGHTAGDRPPLGTLTGFRSGREVDPVPDGSCDLTAHIAADAVAAAGSAVAELPADLVRQTDALHTLGVSGRRPDIELAHRDPGAYVRALARASQATELTDESGLGAHYWIHQPVGITLPPLRSRL